MRVFPGIICINIENNLASPTVKSLEKLAAALKIKLSIIFLTAEQIN